MIGDIDVHEGVRGATAETITEGHVSLSGP